MITIEQVEIVRDPSPHLIVRGHTTMSVNLKTVLYMKVGTDRYTFVVDKATCTFGHNIDVVLKTTDTENNLRLLNSQDLYLRGIFANSTIN